MRVICGGGAADSAYVQNPDTYPLLRMTKSEVVRFMAGERPLLAQTGFTLAPRELCILDAAKSSFRLERTVDGERAILEKAEAVKTGETFTGELRFTAEKDEVLYGLGQHERGVLNHRLDTEYLYQNNMKIPMPVLLSSKGYGLLFDMGCPMIYRADESGFALQFEASDAPSYFLFTADTMDGQLRCLHRLLGTAPLLPRWAFGYIQSRERYKTQQEILDIALRFKALSIPLSCIVLDWLSWEEGKWGNKIVDKARFPDMKAMIDQLHAQDVAFMISIWPNINRKGADHDEMMAAGKLLANLNTYNAFDDDARALYWRQMMRDLVPAGTDAWWCDSTEPFTPDWNGAVKKPEAERYDLSVTQATQYMDARTANDFALRHAQGIYEHQRRDVPGRRVVNLTRSGSPSSARYGVILWSGDIKASWQDYRNQIAEGLNMAMCGIPFWTLDIGAFFVGGEAAWRKWSGMPEGQGEVPWFWNGEFPDGVDDPAYRELYVRWLQMGTFLPVMRSHGTDTPREPWQFGGEGSAWYDAIVKYIRLRYRLLPTVYSLAAEACFTGKPMMRQLSFDFPQDVNVRQTADRYMFGPSLLVCPVTRPMVDGVAHEEVYLPECAGWYAWPGGAMLPGGQTLAIDVPLDEMPLFVRAGAILALGDAKGDLESMHVWAGADGEFTLYLDNGMDYAYEQGQYARVPFVWDDAKKLLTIKGKEGVYPTPNKFLIYCHNIDGSVAKFQLPYNGEAAQIPLFT